MGLFVKKTNTGTHAPLYSIGSEKTVLLVGLGNIDKEYGGTRHNIGFACAEAFADQHDFPSWSEKKDLKCLLTKQIVGDTRVIAIKPTTYMNNSGEAVQAVQKFYKITNQQTLVIHDELDINFGQIRTRLGGGSAGNNGIKSLIQHIGEDFTRIRIGVKNDLSEKIDSADFVLGKFSKEEQSELPKLTREVSTLISEFLATSNLEHETRSFLS